MLGKPPFQEAFLLHVILEPYSQILLQPASASTEQQVNDHKGKNEAKATTAVIADTGSHVVAAAGE
jgi:hypothetical protein